MVPTLAQIDHQVKVERAARAHEDGRRLGRQARAVGADHQVGLEQFAMLSGKRVQSGGPDLLARIDQEYRIEPQLAAGAQYRTQRGDVDGMLPLVICGAAAVVPLADPGERPRTQTRMPLRIETPDDVPVPVGEDGWQVRMLHATRHQKWRGDASRVVQDMNLVAHRLQGRGNFIREIAA